MSLLSKKDHEMVIQALDFYLFNKGFDIGADVRYEYEQLLAWCRVKEKEVKF